MSLVKALQAAAGNAGGENLYVEDVFSTYLYTGNGSTQTIINGIDLDGEGGMVWLKSRSVIGHGAIQDTERGASNIVRTSLTNAQSTGDVTAFNTNGFSLGYVSGSWNTNNDTYASFTFRKAEKFFDVITGTTNASGGGTFSHSLGSAPGCIIVKATGTTSNWGVWHRSIPNGSLYLNLTNAQDTSDIRVSSATDTSITITNTFWLPANQSFVAYLFAHDAGGFGDDGEQNVISCGSFTTDGSGNATADLGWEPQWFLHRAITIADNWRLIDNMRGMVVGGNDAELITNNSNAESSGSNRIDPTATGFSVTGRVANATYIYIAIRRGPMKTPESGTEVFSPAKQTGGGFVTTGWPVDLLLNKWNDGVTTGQPFWWVDRLRGAGFKFLRSDNSSAEDSYTTNYFPMSYNNGVEDDWNGTAAQSYFSFRRAPGFFDVVCYTGNGVAGRTVNHNLGVAPEIIILKSRSRNPSDWRVNLYNVLGSTTGAILQSNGAAFNDTSAWNSYYPDSSIFKVGSTLDLNASGATYVAYLFASVPGVSKVGKYTGTGTTQQINCGFSAGARFVLIKRTDSTGDWYVWDTARGIVAGNDPYLLLNSTAAEVTSTDYVDTYSAGFEISSTAPAAINANGGTFIFLAIA